VVVASRVANAAVWVFMLASGAHLREPYMRRMVDSGAARLITVLFKQSCRPVRAVACVAL
jgi:hypothetical protein